MSFETSNKNKEEKSDDNRLEEEYNNKENTSLNKRIGDPNKSFNSYQTSRKGKGLLDMNLIRDQEAKFNCWKTLKSTSAYLTNKEVFEKYTPKNPLEQFAKASSIIEFYTRYCNIIGSLQWCLSSFYPTLVLEPFGSFTTGLCIEGVSDIDLGFYFVGEPIEETQLRFNSLIPSIANVLISLGYQVDLLLLNARHPVLKFSEISAGIHIDLSVVNIYNKWKTRLLNLVQFFDLRNRVLLLTVRKWAWHYQKKRPKHKQINPFCLSIIAVCYLMTLEDPLVPKDLLDSPYFKKGERLGYFFDTSEDSIMHVVGNSMGADSLSYINDSCLACSNGGSGVASESCTCDMEERSAELNDSQKSYKSFNHNGRLKRKDSDRFRDDAGLNSLRLRRNSDSQSNHYDSKRREFGTLEGSRSKGSSSRRGGSKKKSMCFGNRKSNSLQTEEEKAEKIFKSTVRKINKKVTGLDSPLFLENSIFVKTHQYYRLLLGEHNIHARKRISAWFEGFSSEENKMDTIELFEGFLKFFISFDAQNTMLDCRNNGVCAKVAEIFKADQLKILCVRDPFDLNDNLARNVSVTCLYKIRRYAKNTLEELKKTKISFLS